MNADLPASNEAEAVLETDLRPGVEAEQVSNQIAEITVAESAAETMRHPEGALVSRQAQRGRKIDDREVGLREPEIEIGVILDLRSRSGAVVLRERHGWPQGSKHGDCRDDS